MSYANRYVINRLVFALVMLLLALLFARLFFPQGEPEQERISGLVIEVNQGETQSLRSGNRVELVTARLRLEDGNETRLGFFHRRPRVGETVQVLRLHYPNGEIRYRLIGEHE